MTRLWQEIREGFPQLSAIERKRLFNRVKIAGPRLDPEDARWDELEETVRQLKVERLAVRTSGQ